MTNQGIKERLPFFLMSFLVFFSFEFILAYLQIYKNYASDIGPHLDSIAKIGTLNFPQMGFEYTVYLLSWLTSASYAWISICILSISLGFQGFFTYFLIYKLSLTNKYTSLIFTFIALMVTAVYFPYSTYALPHLEEKATEFATLHFQEGFTCQLFIYLAQFLGHFGLYGIGSPNVWHSPTLTVVKPFAFIITYLYIVARPNIKLDMLISVLLLLSCFYKPSFAIVFLPAVVLYEIFNNIKKIANAIRRLIILVLPSTILLLAMFFMMTYIFTLEEGQHTKIIFAPFKIIHLYSKNALLSFLQATAFPLLVLIIRFKSIITHNAFLLFSWIMLVFGYLFMALFAQSGSLYKAGNFGWSYELCLSLIFTFSIVEYLRISKEKISSTRAVYYKNAINGLLFMHIISGLLYLVKLSLNIVA